MVEIKPIYANNNSNIIRLINGHEYTKVICHHIPNTQPLARATYSQPSNVGSNVV